MFEIDKETFEWCEEHKKFCKIKSTGAIGGRYTYSFTPTGLGVISTVKCACGEEFDSTNYEKW